MTPIFRTKLREFGLNEAARQMGLSPTAVKFWATGDRKPKPEHAVRVAALLGITPADVRPDVAKLMEAAAE